MEVEEQFEQRYTPGPPTPVQVWVYCRHCRCRIQVRTIPAPTLPFRCFCGTGGTFGKFDVFSEEDDIRIFASTFETLYQETKVLMREADMPMPQTAMYSAEEMRRIKAAIEEEAELAKPAVAKDDLETFRARSRELTEKVQRATDVIQRHDLLGEVGRYAFAHRKLHADVRRLCYQACQSDVAAARDVLREASARHKRGEPVRLTFPLVKRYLAMLTEDDQVAKALEVAKQLVSLGLPYDEQVKKLEGKLR